MENDTCVNFSEDPTFPLESLSDQMMSDIDDDSIV